MLMGHANISQLLIVYKHDLDYTGEDTNMTRNGTYLHADVFLSEGIIEKFEF
jgi:hypothetical protein